MSLLVGLDRLGVRLLEGDIGDCLQIGVVKEGEYLLVFLVRALEFNKETIHLGIFKYTRVNAFVCCVKEIIKGDWMKRSLGGEGGADVSG